MTERNLDLGGVLGPRRLRVSCLDYPSEKGCTLTLIGTEEEVLALALWHAVTAHGHEDTPGSREKLRLTLREVRPGEPGQRPVNPARPSPPPATRPPRQGPAATGL